MSMTTYLQMVSDAELESLEADPGSINQLDQPVDQTFTTQMQQTLCYFLCGDGYATPDDHGPIAAALNGYDSIDAPSLENGAFDVVRAEQTGEIADALEAIDLDEIAEAVDEADLESLVDEEELYDIEPLLYDDVDLARVVVKDTIGLRDFYRRATEEGRGVVMYTT